MTKYLLFLLFTLIFSVLSAGEKTALDKYVAKPDPHFSWKKLRTVSVGDVKVHQLHMSSQAWRSGKDVNRILWTHTVNLFQPKKVEHSSALLLISAGMNDMETVRAPKKIRLPLAMIAQQTNSIVAEITCVPNQPLTFLPDPSLKKRIEDEILAWNWSQFLKTNDPEWLTHLPMAKSVVRAMDTVQEYYKQNPVKFEIETFVLTGASKRGWTTWLTAAVDKRVIGIAPMVIDLLNIEKSFKHHHNAYGEYARAVHDYVDNGITDLLGTEKGRQALPIIDPYSYLERYTMPKFIICSSGDEFFLPDSWQFYYNDLLGEKHMRYIPNAGHSMNKSIYTSISSFYRSIVKSIDIPKYSWKYNKKDKSFVLKTSVEPKFVKFWRANNEKSRDFRLTTIKKTWRDQVISPVKEDKQWVYTVYLQKPEKGWQAGFLEFALPDPENKDKQFLLSTGVSVVPETMPFKKD